MNYVGRVLQCKEVEDWKIPACFESGDHDMYMHATGRSRKRAVKRVGVTTVDGVTISELRDENPIAPRQRFSPPPSLVRLVALSMPRSLHPQRDASWVYTFALASETLDVRCHGSSTCEKWMMSSEYGR